MFKRGSLKKESVVNGFGREDMQNKKGNYGKQKRKPFLKDFLFVRCLAESNRSTRFCRPLPNRSVKTPCRVSVTISDKRVQRYYFFLNPPNLSASFFKKYSIFSKIFIFGVHF